ncbi:hypothetical protein ACFY5J_11350 [Peribacillus butanolivorans]|uniref:hypothetical protein n=1 Tax=Peribacillus butanolivorans TaxID=421767 RepID=UPI003671726F
MIKKIQVLDSNYGQQLFMLQKKAYQIEADIIEFTDIPPLLETYDQFINCNETFIGFFKADTLAGAIGFIHTKDVEAAPHFLLAYMKKIIHLMYVTTKSMMNEIAMITPTHSQANVIFPESMAI